MMGWAVTIYMEKKRPSLGLSSIKMRRFITKMHFTSLNLTLTRVFLFTKPQITVGMVETVSKQRQDEDTTRRKARNQHKGKTPSYFNTVPQKNICQTALQSEVISATNYH